jgi:hypothetical protein
MIYLWWHNQAPKNTPLAIIYQLQHPVTILHANNTQELCITVTIIGASLGFLAFDICCVCATALLLCNNVDSGPWRKAHP